MTGLTPERLAEIRANLPDPSADLSMRERNAHALLAEVERLRAGIAQAITEAHEIAHTTGPCTGTSCAGCRTGRLEYGLRDLLNKRGGEDQ